MGASSDPIPSRGPAQGERKIVTVLFADVVGSTSLAETLDPEEWAEIIGGLHARASESITRFGGIVAQLLGDGLLAFFGAPTSHEDDPERALGAALDLLDSVTAYESELRSSGLVSHFQVRVGLNTGLVVVGDVGSGAHVEYLAVGDTVNLAARMQSAAEPGTVLITETTARAARHAYELASLGQVEIKGKAELVEVYRVLGKRLRPGSRRGIAGLDSPIVGREREVAALNRGLSDLMAGHGQIISLIGEAGLGKSRLLAEVVERSPLAFTRAEGRCASLSTSTPYAPIVEALWQLLDPTRDGSGATYMRVREHVPAAARPFIATLLGLPLQGDESESMRYLQVMEPANLRERLLDAIVATVEHLARGASLALLIEDLHWADESTLDVLERLLPVTVRAPLAIIAAFRPGAHEPSWRYHRAAMQGYAERYTVLQLEPLAGEAARTLVSNLLFVEDLPEPVRNLILARAEGNPFYVEEVIRSLLDAGLVVRAGEHWHATAEIASIALPDSLAGVIAARLDRLDATAKAVAQTAAVLGRDFAAPVLEQMLDHTEGVPVALDQLVERELIVPRMPGAYRFKHVLTQEAAYNSLLLSKRRKLHSQAGRLLANAGTEPAATVAAHFLSAREPLMALPHLIAAGEHALGAYSTPESLSLFRQAIEIAQSTGEAAWARRAYEGLGGALAMAGDPTGALANYQAMEAFAVAHGDDPMRVSALNKMAMIMSTWLGEFEPAEGYLNRARDLAQACDDRAGLAEGLVTRCLVSTSRADFENAVEHLGQLVQIGRSLDRAFETAFGLVHTANTWTYMARFERAWPAAQEAEEYARQQGDLMHQAHALAFPMAWCHLSFGDLAAAHDAASQALALSQRIGDNIGQTHAYNALASIARLQGDYPVALGHLRAGLEAAQQVGLPFVVAMFLAAICGASVEMDPAALADTLDLHRQAMALLDHPMGRLGGGAAWADIGECALAAGEPETARRLFELGLSVQTPFMYLHRPRHLAGLARISLHNGGLAAAQQYAADARRYVDERRMAWHAPLVALIEGEVSVAAGQQGAARAAYAAALVRAESMRMFPAAERARRGLEEVAAT